MRVTPTCRLLSTFLGAVLSATIATGTALAVEPAPGQHASTPAERQARGEAAARAFMMGKYDEALATYMDLYIQSDGRPEYLRNIGRCQQKLRQYPRAIESFKEYLRRAKRLGAEEKKEVQGFIADMESAQANESGGAGATAGPPTRTAPPATPAPTPAPVAPAPAPVSLPAPLPYAAPPATTTYPPAPAPSYPPAPPTMYGPPPGAAPPPTSPSGTTLGMNGSPNGGPPPASNPYPTSTPPDLITRAPPPEPAAKSSPLKPIGIVSVVAAGAAAVGGTIFLLRAKSIHDSAQNDGCSPTSTSSFCGAKADSVNTANTVSKILYVGAGALGVAGVVMIAVAPSPTPEGHLSLAVSGRF